MATLGSSGRNKNFSSDLTVPASMVLDGYIVGGPSSSARWYRGLDLKGPLSGGAYGTMVPTAKVAAVKAVLDAENLKYVPLRGAGPWSSPNLAWRGLRLQFHHPRNTAVTPWTQARVNTLLASLHTAITT